MSQPNASAYWHTRALTAERALADADETIRRLTAERDAARSALTERHQADAREAAETAAAAQTRIAELESEVGRLRPLARAQWQAMSEDARKIAELRLRLDESGHEFTTAVVDRDRAIEAMTARIAELMAGPTNGGDVAKEQG